MPSVDRKILKPSSSGTVELSAQDRLTWLELTAVAVRLLASAGGARLVVAPAEPESALPPELNAVILK